MAHSLPNLEHHHFKYPGHRLPLQAHVHFFGADAFSFGEQIHLEGRRCMRVEWFGLGRALQNPLAVSREKKLLCRLPPWYEENLQKCLLQVITGTPFSFVNYILLYDYLHRPENIT